MRQLWRHKCTIIRKRLPLLWLRNLYRDFYMTHLLYIACTNGNLIFLGKIDAWATVIVIDSDTAPPDLRQLATEEMRKTAIELTAVSADAYTAQELPTINWPALTFHPKTEIHAQDVRGWFQCRGPPGAPCGNDQAAGNGLEKSHSLFYFKNVSKIFLVSEMFP